MAYLSIEDFTNVYSKVPRLCVDLVIKNERGILFTLRSTEPFKDMWCFPGGTMYKEETVEEAARRIAKKETGLDIEGIKCMDYLEYFNEKRFDIEIHTVSIVLEVTPIDDTLHHDENASDLQYFKKLPEHMVGVQVEFLKNYYHYEQ